MTTAAPVGPSPACGGPAPYLTHAQHQLLCRLAEGARSADIALELGISEVTLRGYTHRLRAALDAKTNAHAVHRAHQLGLLDSLPKKGRSPIPGAEMPVLRMLAGGLTNAEIAVRLRRPEYTVAEQVRRLRQRLGARDRGHAVALAMAAGVLTPDDVLGTSALPPSRHSA